MQTWNWQTVVALVVGQCVPLVGVGAELERMVVDKVVLLVCYVVVGSSINCASKSAAVIAGCMVVAKEVQASQHVNQLWSLLQNETPKP